MTPRRPFKLHAKTTLLVSATFVVVLTAVAFVYNRITTELELDHLTAQTGFGAYQFASNVADRVAELQPEVATSEEEARLLAERIYERGTKIDADRWVTGDLLEVEVYSFSRGGIFRPVVGSYPSPHAGLLEPQDFGVLLQGGPHLMNGPALEGHPTVNAAVPVLYGRNRQVTGAIAIRMRVPEPKLAGRLNRITVFAMILSVALVAIATYLMFRKLVYTPLDRLLVAMARVERGDLSVRVPPQGADEVGRLTESFNQMIERLRALAEERASYARQLEDRVSDATSALGERNEQLNAANVQLFEMQRQIGQLERLATAGQLAAQFAHEVGTPLNLISGHVQLLQAREADERTRKRLEIIAHQITRIERIVRGMLDQTRRPAARLAPVDLGTLLGRIFDTIAPTLAARRVELEADIAPDLPEVAADSDQLQQVFINLVNNSLDAMPDGGRLTVRAHPSGAEVLIELSDTGRGIAEDDLPRIFDPLFTTKEQGKGAGFGLAVSRQIIEEHGGRITAASTPDEGSTFAIALPCCEVRIGANHEDTKAMRD